MSQPVLTMQGFLPIESGAWLSRLSQGLRLDSLARVRPRRLADGDALAVRAGRAGEFCGVASGAGRITAASLEGKQATLTAAQARFPRSAELAHRVGRRTSVPELSPAEVGTQSPRRPQRTPLAPCMAPQVLRLDKACGMTLDEELRIGLVLARARLPALTER